MRLFFRSRSRLFLLGCIYSELSEEIVLYRCGSRCRCSFFLLGCIYGELSEEVVLCRFGSRSRFFRLRCVYSELSKVVVDSDIRSGNGLSLRSSFLYRFRSRCGSRNGFFSPGRFWLRFGAFVLGFSDPGCSIAERNDAVVSHTKFFTLSFFL